VLFRVITCLILWKIHHAKSHCPHDPRYRKKRYSGPLSWLTDARLVAAVSNAGGLGVLGPNAGLTAETAVSTRRKRPLKKCGEEIRKTKKLTEKPFGVNLIPAVENDIWTAPIVQVIKRRRRTGRGVYRLW
jgi:hypothetical protein